MLFQLTTSRRGRRWCRLPLLFLRDISTHDLTKRSTGITEEKLQKDRYFNSRPHEEVDEHDAVSYNNAGSFQLTTSRRGRPVGCLQRIQLFLFQLTTSRRGRLQWHIVFLCDLVFQLTTSRRGRQQLIILLGFSISISTHDLTKRSTAKLAQQDAAKLFQLTTSRRGRRLPTQNKRFRRHFNSRPHEEVDLSFR